MPRDGAIIFADLIGKLDAPYKSGPSRAWLKIKNPKVPAATRAIDVPSESGRFPKADRLRSVVSALRFHHSIYQFRKPATKLSVYDVFDVSTLTH
jgi:hypothetical protein